MRSRTNGLAVGKGTARGAHGELGSMTTSPFVVAHGRRLPAKRAVRVISLGESVCLILVNQPVVCGSLQPATAKWTPLRQT